MKKIEYNNIKYIISENANENWIYYNVFYLK